MTHSTRFAGLSIRTAGTVAAVATSAVGGGGFLGGGNQAVAAPSSSGAQAARSAPALRHGIVTARTSLTGRSFPTTHSEAGPSFRRGARIDLDCKVHGPSVGGNDLWYGIPITGGGRIWVAAKYVANDGPAPDFCRPSGTVSGHARATVTVRRGPSSADAAAGRYTRGQRVGLVCFVGPTTHRWHYTDRGRWVSSTAVSGAGATRFCADA
ncbi:hypothetical protein FHX74_002812 [Friedmanniella endophytica]|uniref:SH3 domain-containing protein n=1 Tax=Microlunatus kandeliicorticis TaxID=1759536 RepID=A0A7W3ITY7_9ACTN|nr:hypothetical protein [Microlunatus kandeliicorticis]MBA8795184.1 hypothetical protein [Microlunatus kandeliicorticis]